VTTIVRVVLRLLAAALLGGVVLKGLVSVLEPRLVFFPYKGEDATPATLGLPYEQVVLTTSDGERLIAWQMDPERPRADVVYFHGNGGNLSVWLPVFAGLHQLGLRVLALDYRGYGLSSGTPTEQGVYRDAEAVVRHAQRMRGTSPARPLVYWGRSLGGPIAASATRVVMPDAVVLESTFADTAAVARGNPVLRLLHVFASYRFPTTEFLEGFSAPVLILHGDRDGIIPLALGRELFEGLTAPKQFVTIQGADHNDFFDLGHEAYWRPVLEFIDRLGPR
jgi:alpha-beta hydrolase superfamily lysophospholipase